jgi:hypothetical protein
MKLSQNLITNFGANENEAELVQVGVKDGRRLQSSRLHLKVSPSKFGIEPTPSIRE